MKRALLISTQDFLFSTSNAADKQKLSTASAILPRVLLTAPKTLKASAAKVFSSGLSRSKRGKSLASNSNSLTNSPCSRLIKVSNKKGFFQCGAAIFNSATILKASDNLRALYKLSAVS